MVTGKKSRHGFFLNFFHRNLELDSVRAYWQKSKKSKNKIDRDIFWKYINSRDSGADAIKKFTPSLGIPYLGV